MRKSRAAMAAILAAVMTMSTFAGTVFAETEGTDAEAGSAAKLGVVDTKYGQAQGVPGEAYDVTVFKGMPYAAPPVGDLRWHEPEDPEAWNGVKVFDTYGDAPMQWPNDMSADPWKTDFYYGEMPNFSEDCLYLNITTPSVTGDENYPVYVWFHGGGLNHGYSYEIECDPEALAAKGVVVVEVGTRLGVFGYMSLPQLDAESSYGASGNYGLMDSIKAVDWIKENIKGFGGNPDNITIGGQSGGTWKAGAFFCSKHGSEIVNNVIWESWLNFNRTYQSVEDNEQASIDWLKACGLTGDESLEELRAMDADVFMGKEEEYGKAPQSMVQDGKYIEFASEQEAYEAGYFKDVNILVGSNLGEFTQDGVSSEPWETTDDFYSYYKDTLGDLYDKYDFENLVKVTEDDMVATARTLSSLGIAGWMPGVYQQTVFTKYYNSLDGDGKVYNYLFTHRTPGRNDDYYWAWHSSELWYTFGSLRDIPEQREWTDWDHQLADITTSYWANFMTNGDPNGEGLPEWKAGGDSAADFMDLGDEDSLGYVDTLDQFKEMPESVTDSSKLSDLLTEFAQQQYGLS